MEAYQTEICVLSLPDRTREQVMEAHQTKLENMEAYQTDIENMYNRPIRQN